MLRMPWRGQRPASTLSAKQAQRGRRGVFCFYKHFEALIMVWLSTFAFSAGVLVANAAQHHSGTAAS